MIVPSYFPKEWGDAVIVPRHFAKAWGDVRIVPRHFTNGWGDAVFGTETLIFLQTGVTS